MRNTLTEPTGFKSLMNPVYPSAIGEFISADTPDTRRSISCIRGVWFELFFSPMTFAVDPSRSHIFTATMKVDYRILGTSRTGSGA